MIDSQQIETLSKKFPDFDSGDAPVLDQLVQENPWCAHFHVWRVAQANNTNDPELEAKLNQAAVVVPDRTVLFEVLNMQGEFEGEQQVEFEGEQQVEVEGEDEELQGEVEFEGEEQELQGKDEEQVEVEQQEGELEVEVEQEEQEDEVRGEEQESETVSQVEEPNENAHDFLYWLKKTKESQGEDQQEKQREDEEQSELEGEVPGKLQKNDEKKEVASEPAAAEKPKKSQPNDPLEKLYQEERYRFEQEREAENFGESPQKPRGLELIDNFIQKNPSIHPAKPEDVKTIENKARKSGDLRQELATETLADIMIKQKHYEKAINILEDLILKMPQKKPYFAGRIEQIRKDYLKK